MRVLPHVWNLRSRRAFRAIDVLGNFFLRALRRGAKSKKPALWTTDPYSSAGREGTAFAAAPRIWLLREGWRRA
jgi:hypothetical protein